MSVFHDGVQQYPQAAESLARRFHETYERLAPAFGYETRRASAVPWEEVPEQNRQLMLAVAAELLLAKAGASWEQAAIRQLHHWCVAMDERDEARQIAENRADAIGRLEAEIVALQGSKS
jgi:hypothetical protein